MNASLRVFSLDELTISRKFLKDLNVELETKNESELANKGDLSIENKDIEVSRGEENTIRLSFNK